MTAGSAQCSFDLYDLRSNDQVFLPPTNTAESTPRQTDCTVPILAAARLYFNSKLRSSENLGPVNPDVNDYHFDPIEISSKFWLPAITDWWHQQEEIQSKYAALTNVAWDVFSIIPHCVVVDVRLALGWDIIGWGHLNTTGGTLCETVFIR